MCTEGQKVEICCRLKLYSNLSRPRLKMQQDIGTLNQERNAAMIARRAGQDW